MSQVPAYSHFGICVSDVERSVRFYCEGLGFERAESVPVGPEYSPLVELPDISVTAQFLRRGPTTVELLCFEHPAPVGSRERRPVNQFGLTHLAFNVHDVDATAARLAGLGGSLIGTSRVTIDALGNRIELIQLTDPDGVRIELVDPGDVAPSPRESA